MAGYLVLIQTEPTAHYQTYVGWDEVWATRAAADACAARAAELYHGVRVETTPDAPSSATVDDLLAIIDAQSVMPDRCAAGLDREEAARESRRLYIDRVECTARLTPAQLREYHARMSVPMGR